MLLLPIPGAPSTATGSGGTPSHAPDQLRHLTVAADQIGRRRDPATTYARLGARARGPGLAGAGVLQGLQ